MALIGVDCDGVLSDFAGELCKKLRARGFDVDVDRLHDWRLSACFDGVTLRAAEEIIGSPGFCASLPWYPGAANLVRYLRAQGHDVVCVTSPYHSATWMQERREWLSPVFPAEDVIFAKCRRKALVRLDVLIEDNAANAHSWADANPRGVVVLVDRPWNRAGSFEFWPHSRVWRARDTADLVSHVELASS